MWHFGSNAKKISSNSKKISLANENEHSEKVRRYKPKIVEVLFTQKSGTASIGKIYFW